MENKNVFIWAFILLFFAVLIGAFGAHMLKPFMGDHGWTAFQTGSQYHFIHGLAAWLSLLMYDRYGAKGFKTGFWMFVIGTLLFSGSLYLLAMKDELQETVVTFLGPLTPIGGLCFLTGWALCFISTIRLKSPHQRSNA